MKIWRYMDLAKFTSLVASSSLYFPCTTQMEDPFEGWKLRSEMLALEALAKRKLDSIIASILKIKREMPAVLHGRLAALMKQAETDLSVRSHLEKARSRFGISCWHINEHESDAMWKIYGASGMGIAIVSTKERLEAALAGNAGISIAPVRYIDFENDDNQKSSANYGLFQKRFAFAHENELRATITLKEPGVGAALPCSLETLIEAIYIFPKAPSFYVDAVRYVVERSDMRVKPPVYVSKLLDPPDY